MKQLICYPILSISYNISSWYTHNIIMNSGTTENPQNRSEDKPYGVVNISEIKREKKVQKNIDKNDTWLDKLYYWIILSIIPSGVTIILGYFYRQFIFLSIIFPIIAISGWGVRKILRYQGLHEEKWLK